ncbi:MAG: rRNA maturation RNase YbeY [Verrucomicrobia bacterium]|nr:rRNA maturation RNase YbeY [Verrucomicrobiota bacterium]
MKPRRQSPLRVSLSNRQRNLPIARARLLKFLREAASLVAADVRRRKADVPLQELSVAIVDDDAIAAINQQFLNHAGPTDVISFDLGDGLGEIVVSAERAVIVARQLRRPPHAELALYLVHGLLHLAGLDDRTPAQRRAMRAAERRVLRQLRP